MSEPSKEFVPTSLVGQLLADVAIGSAKLANVVGYMLKGDLIMANKLIEEVFAHYDHMTQVLSEQVREDDTDGG